MNPQLPFSEMVGMAQETTPETQPLQPGMGSIIDPNAAAPLAMMHRPVQTPDELEARKSGWAVLAEKLMQPNVMRSLGFMGATMASTGNVGQGMMAGMMAFEGGKYADDQKKRQDQEMALKTTESQANVRATHASAGRTEAATPGVEAQSRVEVETADSRISQARTEAELASYKLKEAKDEATVTALERDIRKRKAKIEAEMPDSQLRRQITAQYDLILAKAQEQRAKAKKEGEDAATKEMERKAIADLKPEELREYLTKTGKYSTGGGASSAIVQQASLWGKLYDGLPANDPAKKGKTKEQYVQARLTQSKQKDALEMLFKARQYMSEEEIKDLGLYEMAKASLGEGPGGIVDAKQQAWQPIAGTQNEYRIRQDGTREIRRKPNAMIDTGGLGVGPQ